MVEFVMDPDYDTAEQLALQNSNTNRMVYYVGPQYRENRRLYNAFTGTVSRTLYVHSRPKRG